VVQVTGLAMCKHNKNDMLLRKMSTFWRHDRADQLFHDYLAIPHEALQVHMSINQPANQPINFSQSINQSINQPINQSINQPVYISCL